ncbi:hypothetical protein PHLCEN_2v10334 [Hermanssonia centrifuga]|uniref:Uncharacterized protein n=1 Tax=Hermanssonia centrifuga TaxID=98765 RepID=A0A2R6NN69_9APHY|nr:hypothetical protein PHLCEN_2v10334 [Hermanssonia centrifuga]
MEGFEGSYSYPQDPTARPTHPLLSPENPYFPTRLQVSSIECTDYSQTPFLLDLTVKTASVETITDVDVACRTSDQIRALGSFLHVVGRRIKKITVDIVKLSPEYHSNLTFSDNLQAFNLSACTTLTELTLRVDLLPYRKDMNLIAFKAASTFLSVTSTTVHTVILEIRIGEATHSWRDRDVLHYLHRIRESAASAFIHFQSVIKQREGIRRLCIRWGDLPQTTLDTNLIERMDLFAQRQLSELDAKGVLCFESI